MRTLLIFLALLSLPALAQTSITCNAVGNCGNQILHVNAGSSSSNNGVWLLQPIVISGSFAVTQWTTSLKSIIGGSHINAILVCDNNLSGTTIASGGNCPANNVVCSLASTLNPPTGDDTFAASGCPLPLATNVRYWIGQNTDNASNNVYITDVGGNPRQVTYFVAGACCTIPASLTGTLASTSQNIIIGLTLSSALLPRRPVSF